MTRKREREGERDKKKLDFEAIILNIEGIQSNGNERNVPVTSKHFCTHHPYSYIHIHNNV